MALLLPDCSEQSVLVVVVVVLLLLLPLLLLVVVMVVVLGFFSWDSSDRPIRILVCLQDTAVQGMGTMLVNADGLLDEVLTENVAVLLQNSLVLRPVCPADLQAKYGLSQCSKVAHGLDALEVAVRAAQGHANLRSLSPVKSAVGSVAFSGATGSVSFKQGCRLNQDWKVSTVESGTWALQEYGNIVGSANATFNKVTSQLWRGKAQQGPAIGHLLHFIVLDDDSYPRLYLQGYERVAAEHNSDVDQSLQTGTKTGGAKVLGRKMQVCDKWRGMQQGSGALRNGLHQARMVPGD